MAKRTLPTSLKQITYRDFDIQFRRHPSTGKLLIKKDDEAVKQALKTLILTNFYEKPFFPRFGGNLRARLFDNFDSITAELFKSQIETAIRNFEPRVALASPATRNSMPAGGGFPECQRLGRSFGSNGRAG